MKITIINISLFAVVCLSFLVLIKVIMPDSDSIVSGVKTESLDTEISSSVEIGDLVDIEGYETLPDIVKEPSDLKYDSSLTVGTSNPFNNMHVTKEELEEKWNLISNQYPEIREYDKDQQYVVALNLIRNGQISLSEEVENPLTENEDEVETSNDTNQEYENEDNYEQGVEIEDSEGDEELVKGFE